MRCGKHALNNALGGEHFFTSEDLEAACDLVLFESMVPDDNGLLNPEEREDHIAGNGWYSEQVLAKALQATLRFRLDLMPLRANVNQLRDPSVVGAIVNQSNMHWAALKWIEERVWRLDSLHRAPQTLSHDSYVRFVTQWPNSFAIVRL